VQDGEGKAPAGQVVATAEIVHQAYSDRADKTAGVARHRIAAGLYGRDARNAITGITLFTGFASTIGWPTSA
jgi:hypothetical protein